MVEEMLDACLKFRKLELIERSPKCITIRTLTTTAISKVSLHTYVKYR